jgi:hypothetical protein
VVIGNEPLHEWTYGSGLTSADKLVTVIQAVSEIKNPKAIANGN